MTNLQTDILTLFSENRRYTDKELPPLLDTAGSPTEVQAALGELLREGLLVRTQKGKLATAAQLGMAAGTFLATERGFGFLRPDDGGEDLFIPPKATAGAWHQDRVLVKTVRDPRRDDRDAAEIVQILHHGVRTVTGTLHKGKHSAYLLPDDGRFPSLDVPLRQTHGARTGDKVSVEITSFGGRNGKTGAVEQIFGKSGSMAASCAAILYENGIHEQFPDDVRYAAAHADTAVPVPEPGREDLRALCCMTIDGATAKDLDDAVSLERLPDGGLRLGVHIADVSYYVTPDSPLDREAFARGTSVYFADRVIPMLPKELSNGICSLNPREPRRAMTVFMDYGEDGKQLTHRITTSTIQTTERMTYDDCNRLLEGGDDALAARYADILPMLRDMAALAAKLEAARSRNGALSLESIEGQILCDEAGEPVDIVARKQGVSERLIEQFMLAANETVAAHVYWMEKPTVYRIHQEPDKDRLERFVTLANAFGYRLKADCTRFDLQRILREAEGRPEQPLINDMLLRSMSKARYSPNNVGHYGLASDCYCHFTSPIRRYPDLVVHRLLKLLLQGQLEGETEQDARAFAAEAASQSSDREIAAATAERGIEKLYMAKFMQRYLGETFEGVISGVQSFGMFVSLPNTVEGRVSVQSLEDDEYEFDEQGMCLTGSRTGKRFKYGQLVRILVAASDPITGRIDFLLAKDETNPNMRKSEDQKTDG